MNSKKIITSVILSAFAALSLCMTGCEKQTYTVTIKEAYDIAPIDYPIVVDEGEEITMDKFYNEYPEYFSYIVSYRDKHFFIDEACRVKYVGGINSDITLYCDTYCGTSYGEVKFIYGDDEYYIYRRIGSTLRAEDFYQSAYGYGGRFDYIFYADEAHTERLDIETYVVQYTFCCDTKNTIYVDDERTKVSFDDILKELEQ